MKFLLDFLSYFIPIFLVCNGHRTFYYKKQIGGYKLYKKDIKYYDHSGDDNHTWEIRYTEVVSLDKETLISVALRDRQYNKL